MEMESSIMLWALGCYKGGNPAFPQRNLKKLVAFDRRQTWLPPSNLQTDLNQTDIKRLCAFHSYFIAYKYVRVWIFCRTVFVWKCLFPSGSNYHNVYSRDCMVHHVYRLHCLQYFQFMFSLLLYALLVGVVVWCILQLWNECRRIFPCIFKW